MAKLAQPGNQEKRKFSQPEMYKYIGHFRITAIWPGDRIRRPQHPTENEVRRCSCDESV